MRLTSTVNMNPARLAGESREDYAARRKAQKQRGKLLTKGPRQPAFVAKTLTDGTPAVPDYSRWFRGQHTNGNKNMHRQAVAAAGGIRQYKLKARFMRSMWQSIDTDAVRQAA